MQDSKQYWNRHLKEKVVKTPFWQCRTDLENKNIIGNLF